MNAQEFLESNEYESITVNGEYYTISRRVGGNWLVYSHVNISLLSAEFPLFDDAVNAYMSMENEQREFHKHDNAW